MPLTEIAIAVVERDGDFLIGQRAAGQSLAGLWEFPGGKLLAGEPPAAAAARECQEETGLHVTVGMPYPAVVHDYDHGRLRLHFFACQPSDPNQEPLAPFRWIPRARLKDYPFPAANHALIEYLAGSA